MFNKERVDEASKFENDLVSNYYEMLGVFNEIILDMKERGVNGKIIQAINKLVDMIDRSIQKTFEVMRKAGEEYAVSEEKVSQVKKLLKEDFEEDNDFDIADTDDYGWNDEEDIDDEDNEISTTTVTLIFDEDENSWAVEVGDVDDEDNYYPYVDVSEDEVRKFLEALGDAVEDIDEVIQDAIENQWIEIEGIPMEVAKSAGEGVDVGSETDIDIDLE